MPAVPAPPEAPCVLAFDTSTEQLAAGLCAAGAAYSVCAAGGAQASARLLPQLQALLARAGRTWADVQAIAYGRGPGAFTGLRTACSVAQGLGLGLGRPLLPLDSLLIVAEDARAQLQPAAAQGPWDVGVAMDARMDEVYASRYRWQAGLWQVLDEPALYPLEVLARAWQGLAMQAVAGSALAVFGARLVLPDAARVELEGDRAAALLRLALHAARHDAGIDAAAALPLYLRDRVAATTAERESARLAAGRTVPA
jgi:tRNA threonylcarbamoyladenosine biosynthesis protein TsaB